MNDTCFIFCSLCRNLTPPHPNPTRSVTSNMNARTCVHVTCVQVKETSSSRPHPTHPNPPHHLRSMSHVCKCKKFPVRSMSHVCKCKKRQVRSMSHVCKCKKRQVRSMSHVCKQKKRHTCVQVEETSSSPPHPPNPPHHLRSMQSK